QSGIEAILSSGTSSANLDRPLQADGTCLGIHNAPASLLLSEDASGVSVLCTATMDPLVIAGGSGTAIPSPSMALALSNALLKTTPPRRILRLGRLESGGNVVSGFLRLEFGLYLILPALPDPYAANTDFRDLVQRDAPRGMLTARVDWTAPEQPNLTLSLLPT